MKMSSRRAFDASDPLPIGLTALEASAGTGKTFALTTLAARAIAEGGVTAGQLLVVTFTEMATAELRDRLRSRLLEIARDLERLIADGNAEVADPVTTVIAAVDPEMRLGRLRDAVAEFDAATISTIHGFCGRLMSGQGSEAVMLDTTGSDIDEVVVDMLLASGDLGFGLDHDRITQGVKKYLALPDAGLFMGFDLDKKLGKRQQQIVDDSRRIAELMTAICSEVQTRRARTATRTFDSMLTDALDLLRAPDASVVIQSLRERYGFVLIDEFQDTDHLQWEIFRTAFIDPVAGVTASPPPVVIVGDPKQSIYRFRSAELQAYLAAIEHAGDGIASLETNWRSDRPLIEALDDLFAGFEFGRPDVAFSPVRASDRHQHARIRSRRADAAAVQPLQIRVVALDDDDEAISADDARRAVGNDVIASVIALLDGSFEIFDPTVHTEAVAVTGGVDDTLGWRPLERRDIAILTRANTDAITLARRLAAAGIPAATASHESVLASDAALQWATLLRALSRPGDIGFARAAAVGWFFGVDPGELCSWSDQQHAELHDTLFNWSTVLDRHGVAGLMAEVADTGVRERLLAQVSGERDLTDLEHIAEVLQVESRGRRISAAGLHELLRSAGDTAGQGEGRDELLSRRIDRDDDAVQVMTVHKAKGLEFPVVLAPYLWSKNPNSRGLRHAVLDDGRRWLDLTWIAGGDNTELTKGFGNAVNRELEGESRRLLYVSLTRAKHLCLLWWVPTKQPEQSPLGALFIHRLGVAPSRPVDFDGLRSSGQVEVVEVPIDVAPGKASAVDQRSVVSVDELSIAHLGRTIERDWRIWSFTSIAAAASTGHRDRRVDPEVTGGTDEMPDRVEVDSEVLDTALALAPAGPSFGTAVHEILERADFTAVERRTELEQHATEILRYRPLDIEPAELAASLEPVLDAPLGGPVGSMRLAELSRADRLDELSFRLKIGALRATNLAEVLLSTTPSDDPVRGWATSMMGRNDFGIALDGWLTGSIDLTFRQMSATDRWRYFLADYKTNRLGAADRYSPEALVVAMDEHDYWLQATIYLVALHRYLRWRIPTYDPDADLGGVSYLFVRAMSPTDPGRGVIWWRPPSDAIVAIDGLLGDGVSDVG